MKKTLIFILCLIIIIISVFCIKYQKYKTEHSEIVKENLEYEMYLNKEVLGTDLTTVINRAIDNNERNSVLKNEEGFYIENDTNSILIDIKMLDEDKTYKMETFYNNEMETFTQLYELIKFECTKINYNKSGKVSYMLFEQKTT